MHIADLGGLVGPTPAASRYMFLGVAIFLGCWGAGSFVLPLTVGRWFSWFFWLFLTLQWICKANFPPLQPKLGAGVFDRIAF